MSITPSDEARAPKRRRGHIRVAAILETGAQVFTEKGYDAATMTEIAARSGTAIGSLYRFFPSKESVADALLVRYAEHVIEGLAALAEPAAGMSPDELAEALIAFRLNLQEQRSFTLALADARRDTRAQRSQFRECILNRLGEILRKALPSLSRKKSEAMALVVQHLLKGVSEADKEKNPTRRLLLAEIRDALRAYFTAAQRSG